jgi:DNA polymerase-1
MAEKLYLIDGTALLYRAYYAFIKQPLINSRGQNTSAIYGTVNSFLKLLDTFSPRAWHRLRPPRKKPFATS